jgi:hypothetical protein
MIAGIIFLGAKDFGRHEEFEDSMEFMDVVAHLCRLPILFMITAGENIV